MKNKSTHIIGLKILFGSNYHLWEFDDAQLSYITPFFLSRQMAKYAHRIYSREYGLNKGQTLLIWDMFGGIATDSIYLSRYFNVITTELDPKVHQFATENIRKFNRQNVNLIHDNCISMIGRCHPEVIYFDPPWGDLYRTKIKNFDFNQVYIDFPSRGGDFLAEVPKKISCVDLVKYLYQQVTPNIIIKSPINSNTFERVFSGKIDYIHKCTNKNLKFIFIIGQSSYYNS